jgi:hypothetical protein
MVWDCMPRADHNTSKPNIANLRTLGPKSAAMLAVENYEHAHHG